MDNITELLNSSDSPRNAPLFSQLYRELKRIARSRMASERPGQTLNTMGLVHEAWMRLDGTNQREWRDRNQFYAAAAEAMRRILVDSARSRLAAKRGGGEKPVELESMEVLSSLPDDNVIAVHETLDLLEQENEFRSKIVKLRFFGGLKHDEIAGLLGVSEKTVRRNWAITKVWLVRALEARSQG